MLLVLPLLQSGYKNTTKKYHKRGYIIHNAFIQKHCLHDIIMQMYLKIKKKSDISNVVELVYLYVLISDYTKYYAY